MSLGVRIGVSLLAASMLGAGAAAYLTSASGHPRVETSSAAACAGCHLDDYKRARHHEGEKPTTCGVCHFQNAWRPQTLAHDWELTGAHANGHCFWCHRGKPARFAGTHKECIDCHRPEYESARDHVGHFATTCGACHTTAAWKPAHYEAPPEPPPPEPTVTTPPTASTLTPPKPKPKPIPTLVPTTKPIPTVVPTTTTSVKPPDIITRPSRHEEE